MKTKIILTLLISGVLAVALALTLESVYKDEELKDLQIERTKLNIELLKKQLNQK